MLPILIVKKNYLRVSKFQDKYVLRRVRKFWSDSTTWAVTTTQPAKKLKTRNTIWILLFTCHVKTELLLISFKIYNNYYVLVRLKIS